ncbi:MULTISPECIES: LPO_1073/Vpar_1526 family protein [unclassified Oceanispirochaeta]|uniref:LPO_1073/Vpar_1526 family protein n=1 Tax=unclassified Oceanispirochaeta TaxID=2635722 RepID=UPI000E096F3C|nr:MULTISPECIES: LPO_1073/Vpar_1526 family protein [unclassified Oceanispirochaeta]MBF9019047.1 hypothetical protein [Oceanispirochaeta sp. M2]NPD75548.1 hypothetical protein [Oceanispirochaeta sp. M1]RDG28593.1 hypothetical protein DV872_26030 [Oceanispirochaeta sp. M1]
MIKQTQKSGDQSENISAGRDVVKVGLSLEEARTVAIGVYNENIYKLVGIAQDIIESRVHDFTEKALNSIISENPENLVSLCDPDFQSAFYEAQKTYVKSGNESLEQNLLILLKDRSNKTNTDFHRIVLNESINTVSKLTDRQLNILSIVYFFDFAKMNIPINFDIFCHELEKIVLPLTSNIIVNRNDFLHFEYTGCGSRNQSRYNLLSLIIESYRGLFLKGVERRHQNDISYLEENNLIIPCINNPELIQINALSLANLNTKLEGLPFSENQKQAARNFFNNTHQIDLQEIKNRIISIKPFMLKVFDLYEQLELNQLFLTSIGISLAASNIERLSGVKTNLEKVLQ